MIIPSFSYGILASSYPRGVQNTSPVMSQTAIFGTTASSGSFPSSTSTLQFTISSMPPVTSPQLRWTYWDGTTGAGAVGNGAITTIPSKQIVSPYNNSTEKLITAYVVDSTTGQTGGSLWRIFASGLTFSYFDARGCTSCGSVTLYFFGAPSGCPAILNQFPESQYLDTIGVVNATSLTSLTFPSTQSLRTINLYGCSNLQSIRLLGIGGDFYGNIGLYSKLFYGLDIRGCSLNADALNQVYTDLDIANPYKGSAYIRVYGNPGITGDNPSIATAKGYVVYGSSSPGSTTP